MITIEHDGTVKFELFMPRASSVHVTGSFNDWSRTSMPMQRKAEGWWVLQCRLPKGEHTFQYLVDGREWLADFAAHGVEINGFGCWVSQLTVEAPRRVRTSADRRPEPIARPAVRTGPLPPVSPARTSVGATTPVKRGPVPAVATTTTAARSNTAVRRENRDDERGHDITVRVGGSGQPRNRDRAAAEAARHSQRPDHRADAPLKTEPNDASASAQVMSSGLADLLHARSTQQRSGTTADGQDSTRRGGGSMTGSLPGGPDDRASAARMSN